MSFTSLLNGSWFVVVISVATAAAAVVLVVVVGAVVGYYVLLAIAAIAAAAAVIAAAAPAVAPGRSPRSQAVLSMCPGFWPCSMHANVTWNVLGFLTGWR
jgi:hypothetical protein